MKWPINMNDMDVGENRNVAGQSCHIISHFHFEFVL